MLTLLIKVFCGLLITCSILVVQSSNPIYGVLMLILAFLNASVLLIVLGHEYMALLLIILYVGALCTFFLFTIIILDVKVEPITEKRLKQAPINIVLTFLFLVFCNNITTYLNKNVLNVIGDNVLPLNSNILDYAGQIYCIGSVLYSVYALYLIIASLILLSAMLGSIVLTLNKMNVAKNQLVSKQNVRDFKQTLIQNN